MKGPNNFLWSPLQLWFSTAGQKQRVSPPLSMHKDTHERAWFFFGGGTTNFGKL